MPHVIACVAGGERSVVRFRVPCGQEEGEREDGGGVQEAGERKWGIGLIGERGTERGGEKRR